LELPVTYALSSAEGFAAGGVKILSQMCDGLCFGTESGNAESLMDTARALLSEEFPQQLRRQLDTGISFPAARQAALEAMGADACLLRCANDILAVEYCKAILSQNSPLQPIPIHREGSYHAETPDVQNPSATSLRQLLLAKEVWQGFVPAAALPHLENAPAHDLSRGEQAILYRLKTMTDGEFEALPYGSEGLWRKLMHASRKYTTLEEIITATKSKRYTYTRLSRMILCAFLGITARDLQAEPPYIRVLAFRERGRAILKQAREQGQFPHIGEEMDSPYWELEQRCDRLYPLFSLDASEKSLSATDRRVWIHK
jgi:predicted nucleotidyltransferase